MIFTLREHSDFLSKPCDEVDPTSVDTLFIVNALRKETETTPCAGLAANQIGHRSSIALMKLNGVLADFTVCINPTLLYITTGDPETDMMLSVEGCVSDPDNFYAVRRNRKVKLFFFDLYGQPNALDLTGFEAIVSQHEVDHLNGISVKDIGMPVKSVPQLTN